MTTSNGPGSKKPKILLVDDREDNLLSIEAILEPNGYQFLRAYSGHQALKILLSEFDFAMILMDVKMPVLSGFETAALIHERERLKNIPIIFITANNYGDENLFKGYKAGGIDYIFKPINPEVLRAKVAVFVDIYLKNALLLAQERNLKVANEDLEKEFSKLKLANLRLQDQITDLAAAVVSSSQGKPDSMPELCDLNNVLKDFLEDIREEVKEKIVTVALEPFPSIYVSRVLMRPLLHQVVRMGLDSPDTSAKPSLQMRSEIVAKSKNINDPKYCQIIFEGSGFSVDKTDKGASHPGNLKMNGVAKNATNSLALCQMIMEQHHGSLQLNRSEGKASTLILSFPVKN